MLSNPQTSFWLVGPTKDHLAIFYQYQNLNRCYSPSSHLHPVISMPMPHSTTHLHGVPFRCLKPDMGKKGKSKTQIKKKTLNPEFQEVSHVFMSEWMNELMSDWILVSRSSVMRSSTVSWPRKLWTFLCGITTWANPTISSVSLCVSMFSQHAKPS